jgi:hypothetical protein
MIKPSSTVAYGDRHIDCQFALEDRFLSLIDDAALAGWTAADVAAAIVDLADNHILKLLAIDDTNRQIAASVRRF